MVLEKTLESPWDCKEIKPVNPKGNQSWIYSLEGLMLKVKFQYFGHLMWRTDSLEKTQTWCWERLNAGGEGDDRGWDGWMALPTQRTWIWASFRMNREAWHAAVHEVTKSRTRLNGWTELRIFKHYFYLWWDMHHGIYHASHF